ncbi:MAG: hypothetical protein NVS1B4_25010 [Gemmatimonadaceae bacterium]
MTVTPRHSPLTALTPPTATGVVDVTVIVMAYNEAQALEPTVREIVGVAAGAGWRVEVLIVDDGSSDGTGEIADRLARETAFVRVVHHATNAGLGGVYRTGFAEARGSFVTFFPADGQFPATIITQFARVAHDVDLVLGYLPARRSSLVAKALSGIERALYRVLFGPLPRFQGILMCRHALLTELPLHSRGRGWAVVMELIIRASRRGYRVTSVATTMRPRHSGRSKVNNLRNITSNARQMFALWRCLADGDAPGRSEGASRGPVMHARRAEGRRD